MPTKKELEEQIKELKSQLARQKVSYALLNKNANDLLNACMRQSQKREITKKINTNLKYGRMQYHFINLLEEAGYFSGKPLGRGVITKLRREVNQRAVDEGLYKRKLTENHLLRILTMPPISNHSDKSK